MAVAERPCLLPTVSGGNMSAKISSLNDKYVGSVKYPVILTEGDGGEGGPGNRLPGMTGFG